MLKSQPSHLRLVSLLLLLIGLLAACGGEDQNIVLPTRASLPTETAPAEAPANDAPPIAETGRLTLGETVNGTLEDGFTPQRWLLLSVGSEQIRFELGRQDESLNLQMQLIAPDGNLVNQFGTGGENLVSSAPVDLNLIGDYVVQISGGGTTGAYTLAAMPADDAPNAAEIALSPSETPAPLPLDEVATEIDPPNPTRTHSPTPSPTIEPTSDLTSLEALPEDNPTLEPEALEPETVESAPEVAEAQPQAPGGRLELGETRTTDITQSGETHRYTFFGNADDRFSVVVNRDPRNGGTLNPQVELQAPSGEIIAENDGLTENILDAFIRLDLPTTGVYTIYVKSADETGTGSYLITLDDEPFTFRDVERGLAQEAQPNEQRLETYGARDVWEIDLRADEVVAVAVEVIDPSSDFNVLVELVAPDGQSWFEAGGGAGNDAFLDQISAPIDGRYRIHIAARNNASIGDYRLWWSRLEGDLSPQSQPAPNSVNIGGGSLSPSEGALNGSVALNETFTHQIRANAAQNVSIVVTGQGDFDPVLRVLDPLGKIMIEVDDSLGSKDPRASFFIEMSGVHTIEILGFEGMAGNFAFSYSVE